MIDKKGKFNKIAYDNAFIAQNYDRINLTVPKGEKEKITAYAKHCGESVNGFINRAIREAMERDLKPETNDEENPSSEEL